MDRDYAVDGLNRATASGSVSLGYDARGNLNASGSDAYGYDQFNLLTSGPGDVVAAYDPAGRLAKVADASNPATRFYYAGDALTTETVSGAIARRYVPGPGTDEPVVWYEGSGTGDRRWLQADERGSVVVVSDGSGAALAINRYDEYGMPYCPLVSGNPSCAAASANKGRFQYTGQMWIGELGLAYYKARMYSPALGRFMQTDPIGYGDGLNWYNYVGGDPINGSDPTGTMEIYESTVNEPNGGDEYEWITNRGVSLIDSAGGHSHDGMAFSLGDLVQAGGGRVDTFYNADLVRHRAQAQLSNNSSIGVLGSLPSGIKGFKDVNDAMNEVLDRIAVNGSITQLLLESSKDSGRNVYNVAIFVSKDAIWTQLMVSTGTIPPRLVDGNTGKIKPGMYLAKINANVFASYRTSPNNGKTIEINAPWLPQQFVKFRFKW